MRSRRRTRRRWPSRRPSCCRTSGSSNTDRSSILCCRRVSSHTLIPPPLSRRDDVIKCYFSPPFWHFFLVGMKLSSLDPVKCIDLQYLGVHLPLPPPKLPEKSEALDLSPGGKLHWALTVCLLKVRPVSLISSAWRRVNPRGRLQIYVALCNVRWKKRLRLIT